MEAHRLWEWYPAVRAGIGRRRTWCLENAWAMSALFGYGVRVYAH
jgi:hypothetical protein